MILTDIQVAWMLPAAAGLYFSFSLALSIVDFKTMQLPDRLTLPLLWLGLLFHSLVNPHRVYHAVFGAIAGYLFLWAIFQVFRYATGKEGLGYGDFKLLAAIGAWSYWQHLPLIVAFASSLGIIYAGMLYLLRRREIIEMPFGPWLAFSGWGNFCWQVFG
ncbi:Pectic enzymes secretion protein outO [Cedecea neteri]|uniref:Pectic enzymes secretion protein outO n=1 Tax=Cedecea neteri TaxID=158822 RepID=A0A291DT72_9ENTR|nr:A24 family peptidase [Cedecea neteri]ATF90778.1 prepilin peptidase [Cedecea neteri]SQA99079.1 Pectic enzymes secretion protein outO [Cedecea neteri]